MSKLLIMIIRYLEEAEAYLDAEITTEIDEEIEVNNEEDDLFLDFSNKRREGNVVVSVPNSFDAIAVTKPKMDAAEWKLEVERGSGF
jgi:hypothetical protein